MKSIFLSTIIVLTSAFAGAATFELNTQRSSSLMNLIKSSGAEEQMDGASASITATNVSCTLERSLGVSCSWKITKAKTGKIVEQELSQAKANRLYNLLKLSGVEEELDGRTSSFNASSIECSIERTLPASCVVIK